MVYTIFLTEAGGVEFVDGPNGKTLRMIGTKDKLDLDEKAQSIRMKLETQKGTNPFFTDAGFDLKAVFDQAAIVGMYDVSVDDIFYNNIIAALSKDPQLDPNIEDFKVFREANRVISVSFKVRTVENQVVDVEQTLDVDDFV
jgi:hypothetical protein